MKKTKTIFNVQIFLNAALVLLLIDSPILADAKMAAPQTVTAAETLSFYKVEQSAHKLTAVQSEIYRLATVASEVFGIEHFYPPGYFSTSADSIRALTLVSIANSVQGAINQRKDWDQPISKTDLEKIKQSADLIKKSIGVNSLAWAWIEYQKGNKKEAKDSLKRGFELAYSDTMKMKRIDGFRNENPMYNAEIIWKALAPLSKDEEKKSLEEQLQKMRTHVSSLPNMQIMT